MRSSLLPGISIKLKTLPMLNLIGQFFKIAMFFMKLWAEKDAAKAEEKKKIATKVIDALKQTDKKVRASRLNAAVSDINRLR